jgi:hypothetical protein
MSTNLYFAAHFSFRETLREYRDSLPIDVEASRSNTRGANHTELGIAIGLRRIRTLVVGPLANDGNVFHHLCERFPTWELARSTL